MPPASSLQTAGLISYHRGNIQVLDRPGLEKASRECYALQTRGLPGLDAANERVAAVRDALTAIAATIAFVGQIHDVRVREPPTARS